MSSFFTFCVDERGGGGAPLGPHLNVSIVIIVFFIRTDSSPMFGGMDVCVCVCVCVCVWGGGVILSLSLVSGTQRFLN